jgi:hypothetical protein
MNNQPLMDAIIGMLVFLELSDSKTIDPDAAVRMIEHIAADLQRLEAAGREQFRMCLRDRSARAESAKERAILETLAESLGLAD